MVYILSQRLPGNGVGIKIDVVGVPDAFPKEAEVAPALERVQFLIDPRAELGQEKEMKFLDSVNIPDGHTR
jgi:hypothetical protein